MDPIDELIEREGSFSNDPADHGGPTKFGITLGTLSRWRKHQVTAADIEALTKEEARAIYEAEFLRGPRIDLIPHQHLQDLVLDIAVMSSPGRAITLLQECLHDEHGQALLADGVIGPNTLRALWEHEPEILVTKLVRRRVIQLTDLVQHDVTQLKWLEGWVTRTLDWLPGIKE